MCHFVGRRLVIARINIILQKQQNEKGYITPRKEKISLKKMTSAERNYFLVKKRKEVFKKMCA